MYLAKYKTDLSNPIIRKALTDRQEMHCAIQKMFGTDRKTSDVLYRINGDSIYISSSKTPEQVDGFQFIGGRDIHPTNERTYRFSIVTFPRKCVDHRKKLLPTEESRLDWVKQQGEKNGFEVITIMEIKKETICSQKKNFNVTAYRYDGELRITDTEKFNEVLLKGIGSMKAYGCGMLIVA